MPATTTASAARYSAPQRTNSSGADNSVVRSCPSRNCKPPKILPPLITIVSIAWFSSAQLAASKAAVAAAIRAVWRIVTSTAFAANSATAPASQKAPPSTTNSVRLSVIAQSSTTNLASTQNGSRHRTTTITRARRSRRGSATSPATSGIANTAYSAT